MLKITTKIQIPQKGFDNNKKSKITKKVLKITTKIQKSQKNLNK